MVRIGQAFTLRYVECWSCYHKDEQYVIILGGRLVCSGFDLIHIFDLKGNIKLAFKGGCKPIVMENKNENRKRYHWKMNVDNNINPIQ